MNKKLITLHPQWVGAGGEGITDSQGNPVLERFGIGIDFDCPCGCQSPCYVPFSNPLDGGSPLNDGHHTWQRTGETFETLTLTPSIQRIAGCDNKWHGFIRDGEIINA